MKRSAFLALVVSSALGLAAFAAEAPKPLRVLLITGGCCHDYAAQKDILKKGIEARMNALVEQIHTDDKSVKPPLPIYGNPDYAKGFDVVIHDECSAGISDPAIIRRFEELGNTPVKMGSADFSAYVARQAADWAPVVKAADMKP